MSAFECIERLAETSLINADLKFCLVDSNKLPFQINGKPARTNDDSTFVSFAELLECAELNKYAGVGISVQASKLCAVDIDHCLSNKNDFLSMNELSKDVVNMFKDFAYIESSFSGYGIRILTRQNCIQNYKSQYYLKNSKLHLEYYQYDQLGRYVTLTGNMLVDHDVNDFNHEDVVKQFLDKYMKRQYQLNANAAIYTDTTTFEELMRKTFILCRRDNKFQSLWFDHAPGHGSNESERDYHLVAEIYDNITKDPNMILSIFKESTFYKTKDREHLYKFNRDNNKYFWYLFRTINGKVS